MKIRGQIVYSSREKIERMSIPEPNSGCWIWLGATMSEHRPYGRLVVGSRSDGTRRTTSAHRLSFETFKGPIPNDMEICHSCDMPSCVNPDHLFLGTRQDNVDDRERKGRNSPPPILRGNGAPWTKFTDQDIAEIRASPLSSLKIAELYQISSSYVRQIRRGEWRNPAPPSEDK